jgi:hypothetical protein
MTNRVELNYILKDEPLIFTKVEKVTSRNVYIWEDKRADLENDSLNCWLRKSEMHEETSSSLMEIWEPVDTILPKKIENKWSESYKLIAEQKFTMEWHPEIKLLRFIWYQNMKSLKESKLLETVIKKLDVMNLNIPPFPSIYN